ncbi:MAG TPA: hypothetical protein VFP61_00915 [Acidimicrobiales bacterium]|nr:hypothetical protein [Acidimicrobiales bacterium]
MHERPFAGRRAMVTGRGPDPDPLVGPVGPVGADACAAANGRAAG